MAFVTQMWPSASSAIRRSYARANRISQPCRPRIDKSSTVYPKLCQSITKCELRRRDASHTTRRVGMLQRVQRNPERGEACERMLAQLLVQKAMGP
jgi:hypothetical protein